MQSGCWPQAQAAEALGVGDGCCPVHLLAPAKADGRFLPTHSIFIHMREDLCPIALCKLEKCNLLVSLSLFFFFKSEKYASLAAVEHKQCFRKKYNLSRSDCTCRTDYMAGEL